MPVEKCGTVFRGRSKVQQKWYHGPSRSAEKEAHEDLQKLEAARSEPARLKKDCHTYVGPQRLSEAEAEQDAQKLSNAAEVSVMSLKQMEATLTAAVSGQDDSLDRAVLKAMCCWLRQVQLHV